MGELLVFKIIGAPVLICAATIVTRRWGPAVGGAIAGLPLTSGPVAVFLALEHGPAFARDSAAATLLGLVAVVAFASVYGSVALRRGPLASLGAATAAYGIALAGATVLPATIRVGAPLVLLAVGWGLVLLGKSPASSGASSSPPWDLPFRMIAAGAMVLALTELGTLLGPRAAGLLSPFPVFASTMAVFSHAVAGAPAAHRLTRGVVAGSIAFGSFFVVVALTVLHASLILVFGIAAVVALAVNALSVRYLLLRQDVSPASARSCLEPAE